MSLHTRVTLLIFFALTLTCPWFFFGGRTFGEIPLWAITSFSLTCAFGLTVFRLIDKRWDALADDEETADE